MGRNRLTWRHGSATVTVTGSDAHDVADAAANPEPQLDPRARRQPRRRGRR
jgi:hypothetical protein